MTETSEEPTSRPTIKDLPRNVWAVGLTSFFMDVSSEMVINILPLFLANVLGVQTSIIGLIEGIAEATASILKLFSGWLSDKLGGRKWLAVAGYGLSAVTKPFFYIASSWELIAGVRWADRVGKGIRTAPRDALVADSVTKEARGLAFGFHRAMDTAGAMVGFDHRRRWWSGWHRPTVWISAKPTFQTIVLISLLPAFLAVLLPGNRGKRCGGRQKARIAEILLAQHGKTLFHLPGDRQHLHPGQFIRCISGAARPEPGDVRHRHPGHAGNLQPDLCAGFNPGRFAL